MTGLRICAWCSEGMGEAPGLEPGQVTHGICPACMVCQVADAGGVESELDPPLPMRAEAQIGILLLGVLALAGVLWVVLG